MKFSLLLAMLAVLVGCSAVGVVESSDPAVKLKQAEDLWARQCRFLPAQGLIAEALDIYRARGDEMGVAEAVYTECSIAPQPSNVVGS